MTGPALRSPRWLALAPVGFLLLVLVAPVLRLLVEAWSGAVLPSAAHADHGLDALSWWHPWVDPYVRWRLLWSALQAALTCGLVLLLGVPVAWVLARFDFAGRRWVLRALVLPFVVPTLVAAMGVLALWGPQGLWAQAGGRSFEDTPFLLLYGNVFFNLCVLVRSATDALEQVSASRVAASTIPSVRRLVERLAFDQT